MSDLGELLIGHVLGDRYRVEEVLGEGGFGVVCRATELRPDGGAREVAVKVLKVPGWIRGEQRERLRDRFRHEASFAARLPPHPNVVPVYDFGTYRGKMDFLVMELLRGEDLRTRLERPDPIPLAAALEILRDAARGIAVGHQGGLVHRDVKPGNIWLGTDSAGATHVRVLDFGIAKLVDVEGDETLTHVTLIGEGVFSRFYAAPEQLRRETQLTRATDVYSLGVVAFEVLTRTRLFTHEDQNRREAGLPVPTPSLRARNSGVTEAVEAIVRKCLADSPAGRYPHAGAVAEALHRECCRHREPARKKRKKRGLDADATAFADATVLDDRETMGADETVFQPAAASPSLHESGDATAMAPDPSGETAIGPDALSSLDPTSLDPALPSPPPSMRQRMAGWLRRPAGTPPSTARRVATTGLVIVLGGSALGTAFAAATDAGLIDRLFGGGAPPAVQARDLNAEGLALFREREYAEALKRFHRALEITPRHPEYWNNYGYTLVRARRFNEAIQVLGALVNAQPEREIAYSNLAEAQLLAGDTAAAVVTLERLLAAGPGERRRREAEAVLAKIRPAPADAGPDTGWDEAADTVWSGGVETSDTISGAFAPGEAAEDTLALPSGERVVVPRQPPAFEPPAGR
jgi:serine/threonine protein kinase